MDITLNKKVCHLLSQFDSLVDTESFINIELEILLKNKLHNGICYLNLRLPKDMTGKVAYLKEKTGLSFSKIALLGINELYLEYHK